MRVAVRNLLGVLGLIVSLPGVGSAATIVLDILDGPNEGFHSQTSVAPVTGNGGRTLGMQRINAFEAAASVWANRLVSNTVIRVSAQYGAQDCEALSGTLAAASPTLVFRNFPGEVKSATWYSWAQANALAGEELQPNDGRGHIMVTINPDVGGPDCLRGLRWDHRIGVQFGGNDVSLFNVLMHEIGHGLGILELVDHDNGTKLNGFNDAFMHQLEDHDLGRKWPAMTNPQRKASLTNTGGLHWVGGNTLLHAARLADGSHAASGHVQMYAPSPLEGSAGSHFDTSLWSGLDELMEPFNGPKQDLVLSHHQLQDIGWPVNHPTVRGLEDLDGRGWTEIAVLRPGRRQPGHHVRVLDPAANRLIQEFSLPDDVSAIDMTVVPNYGDTSASELAVVTWKAKGNKIRVYVHDALSGARVKSIGFPPGFPKAIRTVPSFAGTSAPEILVFGTTQGGAIRVWAKDAKSGAPVGTASFPKGAPGGFTLVPSFAGSAAPEVAMVYSQLQNGGGRLLVKDIRSGANLGQHALPTQFRPQFVTTVGSFGSTAASEIAVLGLQPPTGIPEVHVLDPSSGQLLATRRFLDPFEPRDFATVSDFGATPADELAILAVRTTDVRTRLLVLDSSSGAVLTTTGLPARESGLGFDAVPSLGGSSADDLLVVSTAARDSKLRVYVKDARGAQIRAIDVREGG